ncbi:MAG: DNA mismatch repair protein MutS [Clostridiales bacterium]|nr:DNA mismatch repair protein MutS [Clostridiales bacterium]
MIIILGIIFIVCDIRKENKKIKENTKRYIKETFGKPREDLKKQEQRIQHFKSFYNKGSLKEYEVVDDITWDDLGMDNIFMLINHTDSFIGERYLYSRLHDLSKNEKDLKMLEDKISYFDKNEEKRNSIRKKLYRIGKKNLEDILSQINNIDKYKINDIWKYKLLSALMIVFVIFSAIFRTPIVILGCGVIYTINRFSVIIKKKQIRIENLFEISNIINMADFISNTVPEFSHHMKKDIKSLKEVNKKLFFLKQSLEQNIQQSIFNVIIESIFEPFMWEMMLYNKIIIGFFNKRNEFMNVYKFIGEIELCISILSYRKSVKDYVIPEIMDKDSFYFEEVVHPVVKNAVSNNFEYHKNTILTGANASGKSTFIKAVAINLILGQTINTCIAKKAVIPKCGVITSMAVRDDILTGESYYFREIKYLKRMVELCKSEKLIFFAIDEILKGTNTKERIAASKAVLEYFKGKRCMLLISTHDLEIARYFKESYDNYYFSEVINENDILFDYILHKGICASSNAIKLLQVVGFPQSIIEYANSEINQDSSQDTYFA